MSLVLSLYNSNALGDWLCNYINIYRKRRGRTQSPNGIQAPWHDMSYPETNALNVYM